MKESCNFEIACLRRRIKKEKHFFGHQVTFWLGTFVMPFRTTRCVIGHEALENEWYEQVYRF